MFKINYHEIDLRNSEYVEKIVKKHYPEICYWEHTEGEFDGYDVNFAVVTQYGVMSCTAECKLRYGINMTDFPNSYLNSKKYRWLMEHKQYPHAFIGYDDGVIEYYLPWLPKDDIYKDIIEMERKGDELPKLDSHEKKPKGYVCPENNWCKWEWVWNNANNYGKGGYGWELNVKLPIPQKDEKIKGVTMLYNVN